MSVCDLPDCNCSCDCENGEQYGTDFCTTGHCCYCDGCSCICLPDEEDMEERNK